VNPQNLIVTKISSKQFFKFPDLRNIKTLFLKINNIFFTKRVQYFWKLCYLQKKIISEIFPDFEPNQNSEKIKNANLFEIVSMKTGN